MKRCNDLKEQRNLKRFRKKGFYDFGDGRGAVPAHLHPNGGGIVADSAWVHEEALVEEHARVFGEARIWGSGVQVQDCARVGGWVDVFGVSVFFENAEILGWSDILHSQIGGKVLGWSRVSGARIAPGVELYNCLCASMVLKKKRSIFGKKVENDGASIAGWEPYAPRPATEWMRWFPEGRIREKLKAFRSTGGKIFISERNIFTVPPRSSKNNLLLLKRSPRHRSSEYPH
ncbi:MAG: hypothetical protein ACOY3I_07610 [Verrucomicrobiota bacterium]